MNKGTKIKIRQTLSNVLLNLGIFDLCYKFNALCIHHHSNAKYLKEMKKRESGWEDERYKIIKQYHNIHEGERCFIVCTGPSLKVEDVNKLKNEYTLSMNSIIKLFDETDWRPTYYMIGDYHVINSLKNDSNFQKIKKKFRPDICLNLVPASKEDIIFPAERYGAVKYGYAQGFSGDLYVGAKDGGTIAYDVLQLAVYMGFKEIYLLGSDCDYSGKAHFKEYNEKLKVNKNIASPMIESYKVAKAYCDKHDIKIYNATRGGKLEVFPRVDFDSIFDNSK